MGYTEIKIVKVIDENEHYDLTVAELPGVDLPCYALVNRGTGVVEMSTSVLPNAKKFHKMLNSWTLDPPGEGEDGEAGGLPDLHEILQ